MHRSAIHALLLCALTVSGCELDQLTGDDGSSGPPATAGDDTAATTGSAGSGSGTAADGSGSGGDGTAGTTEGPPVAPEITCGDGVFDGSLSLDTAADILMLDGVHEVTGEIQLNATAWGDVDFMHCLDTIGGDLTIFGNDALTDLSGLDTLTALGGNLLISENGALPDLNGLNGLDIIDRDISDPSNVVNKNLVIEGNDAMTQISGLTMLTVVYGDLAIQNNAVLLNIDGLLGLRAVGGILSITNNPMLCTSSVDAVGAGIEQPAVPPDTWTVEGTDDSC